MYACRVDVTDIAMTGPTLVHLATSPLRSAAYGRVVLAPFRGLAETVLSDIVSK